MSIDTLNVRGEIRCFFDFVIVFEKHVGKELLNEWLKGRDAGADETNIGFDAGPDGYFEDVV